MKRADRRRPRLQPYPHSRDNAVIRLSEDTIEDWPKAILRGMPVHKLFVVEGAVAGAQDITVSKYHFKTARKPEVIEVGCITRPFIESVAEHSTLRRSRSGVEHQFVAEAYEFVVHRLIAHSRL